MSYNEIQSWCMQHGMTIKSLAAKLGMSAFGFRNSIERETLPLKKVVELTKIMGVSPNVFFDYKEPPRADFGDALIQQLKIKDEQINALIAKIN